ncbi:serine peptidase [Streptomyces sp. NPDC088341]|uniref:serine peptidase n=1 Tax=Streptomyces sp. NPDC088341 TaxID=3154870 RepID=UPI003442230A
MTRVLGFHGVRNYKAADTTFARGGARLTADWLEALGPAGAGLDLQHAYYADLLRDERQGGEPTEDELALVGEWAAAWGVELDGVQGRATGWLRWVCGQIAQRTGERPAVVERTVKLFFPEVTRYFATGRTEVRKRVREALLRHRPEIVVAHSLGSVVAYEALHELGTELEVRLLLTLGSPLALPNAVFHRLAPGLSDGRGSRPAGVGRWVNIADTGDFVAVPKGELARLFSGVEQRPDITIAPLWPHYAHDYLRHPDVGQVLTSAR